MTNYVTIGTFGDTTATGWTSFTLPPGASRFYISNAGNDTWDGTAPAFVSGTTGPKATYSGTNGAHTLVIVGRGDWLLYRKGDTFNNDNRYMPTQPFGGVAAGGGNSVQPFVVGSYDPAHPTVV